MPNVTQFRKLCPRLVYPGPVTGARIRCVTAIAASLVLVSSCASRPDVLTFSGSVARRRRRHRPTADRSVRRRASRLDRRSALHPRRRRCSGTSSTSQWLNAWAADPDVLQLDVVWTPEFAAAGWILPLDALRPRHLRLLSSAARGRPLARPAVCRAVVRRRRDAVLAHRSHATRRPRRSTTLVAGRAGARRRRRGSPTGSCGRAPDTKGSSPVFLEYLTGFGGRILDDAGRVVVDSPAGRAGADRCMRDAIRTSRRLAASGADLAGGADAVCVSERAAPRSCATGRTPPRCCRDPTHSAVAGRFAVAPMPHDAGGESGGGARRRAARDQRATADQPERAWELVAVPDGARTDARARAGAPDSSRPGDRSTTTRGWRRRCRCPPADARAIIEHAVARPVTPVYTRAVRYPPDPPAPRADGSGIAARCARGGGRDARRAGDAG